MTQAANRVRTLVLWAMAALCASRSNGQVFGTQDDNSAFVSATAFTGPSFNISGSLGRFADPNADQHFYAAVPIPAGAEIHELILNNFNDGTAGAIVARLWWRSSAGITALIGSVASTPHSSWADDVAVIVPYGMTLASNVFWEVEILASPNLQFFGHTVVKWSRDVSFASSTPSFGDVPVDHPFYQYIEALKASGITGGCQAAPPLYCPDNPVTRGQMAVFLAKALGLHWPF
ncbi:MAG: S-layer homology domain-containing protein [Syntrophomonadaceae bacterium]